jgi:rare lipoprotein A
MKTFQQFMAEAAPFAVIGPTSSYGPGLYGNKTASGQVLTPTTPGIAHKTLPLGSQVRLTVPGKGGRSVVTKVIDRGPYVGDRQADLTTQTTRDLGFKNYKQYGVRNIDVTPVGAKPSQPKPKKPPIIGLPD